MYNIKIIPAIKYSFYDENNNKISITNKINLLGDKIILNEEYYSIVNKKYIIR